MRSARSLILPLLLLLCSGCNEFNIICGSARPKPTLSIINPRTITFADLPSSFPLVLTGSQFVAQLEESKLPYVVRPFHLHDFLEKVSDLLVEVKAIEGPLRMTRYEFGAVRKKKKANSRTTSMFASRDSYSYTEEELAEYEKQEAELSQTKKTRLRTDLGNPRG